MDLYEIDDGERHHVVAESPEEAKRTAALIMFGHEDGFDDEGREPEVSVVPEDKQHSVRFEGGPGIDLAEVEGLEADPDDAWVVYGLPAAWVEAYPDGGFVSSTVF